MSDAVVVGANILVTENKMVLQGLLPVEDLWDVYAEAMVFAATQAYKAKQRVATTLIVPCRNSEGVDYLLTAVGLHTEGTPTESTATKENGFVAYARDTIREKASERGYGVLIPGSVEMRSITGGTALYGSMFVAVVGTSIFCYIFDNDGARTAKVTSEEAEILAPAWVVMLSRPTEGLDELTEEYKNRQQKLSEENLEVALAMAISSGKEPITA